MSSEKALACNLLTLWQRFRLADSATQKRLSQRGAGPRKFGDNDMQRFELSKLSKGIGVACLLAMGSNAHANIQAFTPSAYAEAALNLFNFTLLAGDQAEGRSGIPLDIDVLGGTTITTVNVDSNGGSTSDLNGGGGDTQNITGQPAGTPFAIYTSEGAGYVANTHFTTGNMNGTNTFVGGTSSTYGNALAPIATAFPPVGLAPGSDPFQAASACEATNIGDCIYVQSQVNLKQNANGSGQSDQGLGVQFIITTQADQWFEVAFDAQAFLRAAIGQNGLGNSADADIDWSLTLEDADGNLIVSWEPNGRGAIDGDCLDTDFSGLGQDCIVYTDDFDLSRSVQTLSLLQNDGDRTVYNDRRGSFELEAFLLAGVTYTLTIDHSTSANASVAVPEPTSLALAGLGLVAAGAARRRKQA